MIAVILVTVDAKVEAESAAFFCALEVDVRWIYLHAVATLVSWQGWQVEVRVKEGAVETFDARDELVMNHVERAEDYTLLFELTHVAMNFRNLEGPLVK